jgi:hypothetical protein
MELFIEVCKVLFLPAIFCLIGFGLWYLLKDAMVLHEKLDDLKKRAKLANEKNELSSIHAELTVISKACWHKTLYSKVSEIAAILETKLNARMIEFSVSPKEWFEKVLIGREVTWGTNTFTDVAAVDLIEKYVEYIKSLSGFKSKEKSHPFSEDDMLKFAWFVQENLGRFSDDRKTHFEGEFLKVWEKQKTVFEPTGQDTLTKGTILYNFDTKEEDVVVDYENGRSSITAKGRAFHVSANVLGGGWKAVRKIRV